MFRIFLIGYPFLIHIKGKKAKEISCHIHFEDLLGKPISLTWTLRLNIRLKEDRALGDYSHFGKNDYFVIIIIIIIIVRRYSKINTLQIT